MRVLIIDDERLARERVRALIETRHELEIVGEASTGPEATETIDALRPDLVFLDISLPTMDGFEVLTCLQTSPLPLVIFITAFDQHAIRAFDVHAVDYLLKPLEPARFHEAITRAMSRVSLSRRQMWDEQIRRLLDHNAARSGRLVVRQGERFLFLKPSEIDSVESVGNYVRISSGPDRYLLRQTLVTVETQLRPYGFIRIQRSVLVNADRVVEVRRQSRDQFFVILTSGTKVRLSPNYRTNLEDALGRL